MKISLLLVDDSTPRPDDGYYIIRECELQGYPGEYFVIDSNGVKIPISDDAYSNKKANIEKSLYGETDWVVTLPMPDIDEGKVK